MSGSPMAGSREAGSEAAMTLYTPDADRTQGISLEPCPICETPAPPGAVFCPECGFLLGSTPGPEIGAALPQLRLGDGTVFPLQPGENTVGRQGADINLPDATVSRRHAVVRVDDNNAVIIEDQGSTNGTRVAGRVIASGQSARAADGDTVRFGNVQLTVQGASSQAALPAAGRSLAVVPASPAAGSETAAQPVAAVLTAADGAMHALAATTTTIGRRSDNDIVLTGDPFVSGAHAQILFDGSRYMVTDLGSTNGTRINDRRLAAHTPSALADNDEVVFGKTVLSFRIR